MYQPSVYLAWIRANAGRLPYDLVLSGMPLASAAELGEPASPEDPAGLARLNAAIAAHHDRPLEEVVPALGTSHALWLAYAATLSAGDHVLVELPTYEPLIKAASGMGVMVHTFARRADEGFALDISRVEASLSAVPAIKLVSLSNLHNPSGVRIPDEQLRELAARLHRKNVLLHVDEVYSPFEACLDASGGFRDTARRLGSNVVATGSLTKVFGLALHRIGWLLASPGIAARARDVLDNTMGHPPVRWSNLAAHAFSRLGSSAGTGGLAERSRRLLGNKRETVAAWFRDRPHFFWSAPAEGLYGMAICRNEQFDVDAAIEKGAREEQVVVAPGRFFGEKSGFRLAWSIDEALLPEALTRLDRVFSTAR